MLGKVLTSCSVSCALEYRRVVEIGSTKTMLHSESDVSTDMEIDGVRGKEMTSKVEDQINNFNRIQIVSDSQKVWSDLKKELIWEANAQTIRPATTIATPVGIAQFGTNAKVAAESGSTACPKCLKVFKGNILLLPSNLRRHMRQKHSRGSLPLRCLVPACGEIFSTNHNVRVHMAHMHPDSSRRRLSLPIMKSLNTGPG